MAAMEQLMGGQHSLFGQQDYPGLKPGEVSSGVSRAGIAFGVR